MRKGAVNARVSYRYKDEFIEVEGGSTMLTCLQNDGISCYRYDPLPRNDDANRALMSSNMQKWLCLCFNLKAPIVLPVWLAG